MYLKQRAAEIHFYQIALIKTIGDDYLPCAKKNNLDVHDVSRPSFKTLSHAKTTTDSTSKFINIYWEKRLVSSVTVGSHHDTVSRGDRKERGDGDGGTQCSPGTVVGARVEGAIEGGSTALDGIAASKKYSWNTVG